jgi:hypothetical protein
MDGEVSEVSENDKEPCDPCAKAREKRKTMPRKKKTARGDCPGCLKRDYCVGCVRAAERATRPLGEG